MTKRKLSLSLALSVSSIVAAPVLGLQIANAQETGADEDRRLDTVTVNATKRDANEEDLPIAIEVYSADDLAGSGVVRVDQLSVISPSVNVQSGGAYTSPFIRGIGSLTNGPGVYGSVAVYVDGIYQPNQIGLSQGVGVLNNLESVQVLKGPQGTLYGRNATGGAILFTTKSPEPGQDLSGYGQLELGDFGVERYAGGVGFGLGDHAAASFNFDVYKNDGFVENRGTGRDGLDDDDGYWIGGKLALEPTDRLSFLLSAGHSENERGPINGQQVAQADNFAALPGLNNPQTLWAGTILSFLEGGVLAGGGSQADADAAVGAAFPTVLGLASGIQFFDEFGVTADNAVSGFANSNGVFSETGPFPAKTTYETTNIDLNSTLSFDTFDLVSLTSYIDSAERNVPEVLRADPTTLPDVTVLGLPALFNAGNIGFSQPVDAEAFSQEFYAVSTAGSIEWIVGAAYFEQDAESGISSDAFGTSTLVADNLYSVESVSAYGEATFPINDVLSATAGLRFTDEEYAIEDRVVSPLVPNIGNVSLQDDQLTYNAKLTYDNGDFLAYGGITSGFKSGSLNSNNPSAGQVAPEELISYEAGFKSQLNNGIRLTGAAFIYDFSNIQLIAVSANSGATFIVDGVEADISGLEFGIEAPLSDSFDVFASATVLDHEYKSDATIVATGEVQQINGNKLAQTADLAASFGVNYNQSLNSGAIIGARLLGNYNSGFWADQLNLNGSGGADDEGYFVANASVDYVSASGFWTLSGYVNNLFDEEYYTGGFTVAGGLSQISAHGRPLHAGVKLRLDF